MTLDDAKGITLPDDFLGEAMKATERGQPFSMPTGTPPRASTNAESLVRRVEQAVQDAPERAFTVDESGLARLSVEAGSWSAGRFSTPTIGELRERARAVAAGRPRGTTRLFLNTGPGAHVDIGALQGSAKDGTLFQVASQFNALEAPSPGILPVRRYFSDPTQGPRASISAFPATLLRHYRAPGHDGPFEQTHHRSIDLLADALPKELGQVSGGYLSPRMIKAPEQLAAALEERLETIRVGLHERAEVVFGHAWSGAVRSPAPIIHQVFTSTIALGMYGRETPQLLAAARPLLKAAYLGTLLAARALGADRVVLTSIGGGVFGNPHTLIWEAIRGALEESDELGGGLDVIWNLYSGLPRDSLGEEVLREAESRQGGLLGG